MKPASIRLAKNDDAVFAGIFCLPREGTLFPESSDETEIGVPGSDSETTMGAVIRFDTEGAPLSWWSVTPLWETFYIEQFQTLENGSLLLTNHVHSPVQLMRDDRSLELIPPNDGCSSLNIMFDEDLNDPRQLQIGTNVFGRFSELAAGGALVAGYSVSTVSFGGGEDPIVHEAVDGLDGFIAKYNNDWDVEWLTISPDGIFRFSKAAVFHDGRSLVAAPSVTGEVIFGDYEQSSEIQSLLAGLDPWGAP